MKRTTIVLHNSPNRHQRRYQLAQWRHYQRREMRSISVYPLTVAYWSIWLLLVL